MGVQQIGTFRAGNIVTALADKYYKLPTKHCMLQGLQLVTIPQLLQLATKPLSEPLKIKAPSKSQPTMGKWFGLPDTKWDYEHTQYRINS